MIETDTWPFVRAKHFRAVPGRRTVRVIVLHSMEAAEKGNTAENVARYFQHTDRPASAHVCLDNNSIVQCVLDNDVAFAAPGANADGIHIEMAGYARQTTDDWLDEYSRAVIENAANVAAQYCLKYNIPVRVLSDSELKAGWRGIVSHAQVSAVYKRSTHTDPGAGFPWHLFIDRVLSHYARRKAQLGGNA